MERLARAVIIVIAVSLHIGVCQAGTTGGMRPGVRGGYYGENDDFYLGVDARFRALTLNLNPSVEYVFVDGGKLVTFNADATATVLKLPLLTGWVGGGLGLMYVDPDEGESSTDPLFNLIAGVGLGVPLSPYLMVKWVFADSNDGFAVGAGIRF
jgi:hypothetical protein